METHPDKDGGDETKFQAVARAYEVLGDDTKKQIYDQYGAQGVDQAEQGGGPGGGGGGGGGDPFDIFNSMFGGGFGGGGCGLPSHRGSKPRAAVSRASFC